MLDQILQNSISKIQSVVQTVEDGQKRLKEKDDYFSNRYRDNMNLFAAVMPHIYDEFKDFKPTNRAIYLEECGDLNLYDSALKTSLFSDTPRESALKKVNGFIEKPFKTHLDLAQNQAHPSRHVQYGNRMIDVFYREKEKHERPVSLPKYVPAMVLFGLEFGYQLEQIVALRDIKHLYIYERDLDYFYYSLFAIDWQPVLEHFNRDGHTINFLLGVSPKDITDKYLVQLEENGFFLAPETYLFRGYKSPALEESFEEFRLSYPRQAMGWGFFDDALIGVAQGLKALPNMDLCLFDLNKKLPRWQQDIPVFILGNGPSLDNGIELLKEVRDKVIVISCGSTINTLRKVGIKPDFHVDVERMKQTVDKLTFFEEGELSGIVGLTVDVMHPDFYQYFDRTMTGGKPGEAIVTLIGTALASESKSYMQMNHSAPFVANLALSYCDYFGFKNLYFLGVDNGYLSHENHHSKHSGYYKDGKENGFQSFALEKTIPVPGNFGGTVYSTNYMHMSRVQLEALLNRMHKVKRLNCYNLSNGAKIDGAEPLAIEDVMIFDEPFNKEVLIKTLYETFTCKPPESLLGLAPETALKVNEFMETALMLKSGWKNLESREQVVQLLWQYHRTLYLMKATKARYLYDLLKGSFTSSAFLILSVLYQIENENVALEKAKEVFDIWCEFLDEMPEMLKQASAFIDKGDDHLIRNYNG
ncbi:MAG: 6-hydroxymethylpterin diphosphokinase MptE-like protein [Pseudomonadota bacterium]|nr:6-hydroxymethylpterin diphosphokinase MptE-like protein [Pseudomonadota bacterium]